VIFEGDVWDDANRTALKVAERDGLTYVHPFADPAVIAGQGTVALEILADAPDTDTLIVAIGGGGLIAGTATAAKALKPGIRIIGVEPVGAPTLRRSVEAGELVELSAIETRANTLAPRRSEQINLDLISRNVDDIVLVDDDAMIRAAQWLWFELGLAVELSAAAGIAALREGAYSPTPDEKVSVVICGAGTDGIA
jgi:threonine dehydratase